MQIAINNKEGVHRVVRPRISTTESKFELMAKRPSFRLVELIYSTELKKAYLLKSGDAKLPV